MGWQLITSTGQTYTLRDGAIAGRSTSADIVLNDGQASRQHVEFRVHGGQVMVRDLGSTNGTYVNQTPITAPYTLRPGDQLRIGATVLALRWAPDAAPIQAAAMQSEQRQQVVIVNQPASAEAVKGSAMARFKYCPSCGDRIAENARHCPKCGANLTNEDSGGQAISERDWLTTLLLCILVGALGVHRFYTGHIGTGILQLLTLGGGGLWVLIDLILIVTGKFRDSEGRIIAKK